MDGHHQHDGCDGHTDEPISPELDEVIAAEKVINAFFYFKRLGREKTVASLAQLR